MKDTTKYALMFLLGTIFVVSILLPFASSHPDGLEKVAETLGFIDTAEEIYTGSPIPDYDTFGDESYISVFIAEIVGITITLLLGLGIGYVIKKGR